MLPRGHGLGGDCCTHVWQSSPTRSLSRAWRGARREALADGKKEPGNAPKARAGDSALRACMGFSPSHAMVPEVAGRRVASPQGPLRRIPGSKRA